MQARSHLLDVIVCTSAIAYPIQVPPVEWSIEYGGTFYCVTELSDGSFIVAGHRFTSLDDPGFCLFSFTSEGEHNWSSGYSGFQGGQVAQWVEELNDGGLIVAGSCAYADTASDSAIMLMNTDSQGGVIWAKAYDFPGTDDAANCVIPLDDGGFALAGYSDAWMQPSQTVVMKTDSQGDTLWTSVCSEQFTNEGLRLFQIDEGILVYSSGIEYSSGEARILLFSEADGSLLWEYGGLPAGFTSGHIGGDMCLSADDGYTLVSSYWPHIVHIDSSGNVLWDYEVPTWYQPFANSLNPTMDGGYIYGGEIDWDPDIPGSIDMAQVVKFDSEGTAQWGCYLSDIESIQEIRQLSEGGYIACGTYGALIRFSPETGIETAVPAALEITSLSPNPFSSSLSVSFCISEPCEIGLSVHDISGRRISTICEESLAAGDYTRTWIPRDQPAGCYIIRLVSPSDVETRSCVFLD